MGPVASLRRAVRLRGGKRLGHNVSAGNGRRNERVGVVGIRRSRGLAEAPRSRMGADRRGPTPAALEGAVADPP